MLFLSLLLSDPVVVWGAELSSLVPLRSSDVKMVSEKVRVVLNQDSAVVRASYVFVNLGAPVSLRCAFPKQESMRGFTARVNGKKVSVSEGGPLFHELQDSTLRLPEGFEVAEEVFSWFQDNPWFVHQLSFAKGETLRISHSYTLGVGSDSHTGGIREFHYYLKTGSLWAEAPETVEVEVVADRIPAECFMGFGFPPISPLSCSVSGDTIRWTWTNQEPSEDISVIFREPNALWIGRRLMGQDDPDALFDGRRETGISISEGDSLLLVLGNPQALSLYPERDPERCFRIIPRFLDSLCIEFTGLVGISGQGQLPSAIVPGARCLLLCDTSAVMLGEILNLPALNGNPRSIKDAWRCYFGGESWMGLPVIAILIVAESGTGTLSEVKLYPNPVGFFGEGFWRENQIYFKGLTGR
ncbi:MAG: hypothetical protein ABIM74_10370 [candidate division WOR-3 bacterium]